MFQTMRLPSSLVPHAQQVPGFAVAVVLVLASCATRPEQQESRAYTDRNDVPDILRDEIDGKKINIFSPVIAALCTVVETAHIGLAARAHS